MEMYIPGVEITRVEAESGKALRKREREREKVNVRP